jgi:hypothetical protein
MLHGAYALQYVLLAVERYLYYGTLCRTMRQSPLDACEDAAYPQRMRGVVRFCRSIYFI